MVKERIELALSRARYAAIGAAVGAGVGGLFNRNAASSGAALGALAGAVVGEQRLTARSRIEAVKSMGSEAIGGVRSNGE